MVHHLEVTRLFALYGLLDVALNTLDDLFRFGRFLNHCVEPINSGYIGIVIQSQSGIVTQEFRDLESMAIIDPERMLLGRAAIADQFDPRARDGRLNPGFDLVHRFHKD
jgi:hypothetical protein